MLSRVNAGDGETALKPAWRVTDRRVKPDLSAPIRGS
jgi:hypothetical protein